MWIIDFYLSMNMFMNKKTCEIWGTPKLDNEFGQIQKLDKIRMMDMRKWTNGTEIGHGNLYVGQEVRNLDRLKKWTKNLDK